MKGKESGVDGPRQTRAAAVQLYLNGLRNPAESEEPDSYHSCRVCDEIKQQHGDNVTRAAAASTLEHLCPCVGSLAGVVRLSKV